MPVEMICLVGWHAQWDEILSGMIYMVGWVMFDTMKLSSRIRCLVEWDARWDKLFGGIKCPLGLDAGWD